MARGEPAQQENGGGARGPVALPKAQGWRREEGGEWRSRVRVPDVRYVAGGGGGGEGVRGGIGGRGVQSVVHVTFATEQT